MMGLVEHKPKTLPDAIQAYADPDFALAESADSRWPKGVSCAYCGADSPMFLKTRKIWKCSKCRKQFSLKAGTLLEDSPIGLDKWLPAIWMIANARENKSLPIYGDGMQERDWLFVEDYCSAIKLASTCASATVSCHGGNTSRQDGNSCGAPSTPRTGPATSVLQHLAATI